MKPFLATLLFMLATLAHAEPAKFVYTVIWVKDVRASVKFYSEVFALKTKTIQEMPGFTWAELDTGSTTLGLSSLSETKLLFPGGVTPNDPARPPSVIQVSFAVADVQAAYDRGLKAGARGLAAPKKQPWGQTIARLRDPDGVLISIVDQPPAAK